MKVLQVNVCCGRGSTGRIATDLADILAEQGHECRIAYGRDTVPKRYQSIAHRIGNDWDVRFHGVKTRLLDAHGFASKSVTARFLDWVQDYDPDIIHLHNIHGYYLQVELLFDYLKQAGKPVIWTLHDCWSYTGHCSHYDAVGCRQWQNGCHRCTQLREYPTCVGFSDVRKNYGRKRAAFTGVENMTLVTPSQWLADEVRQSFLGDYPVQVIPNGIDLSVFHPTESDIREQLGIPKDKPLLLGIANVWTERKGLSDLCTLAQILGASAQLVLVGLSKAQKAALPKNIIGMMRTHNAAELAALYTAADVFLNPTHEDNFPTTNLESLACGAPVITYRTGGSPESLDEKSGIVVDAAPEQMAAALPAALKLRREDCLRRAMRFDKWQRFADYLRLYEETMK